MKKQTEKRLTKKLKKRISAEKNEERGIVRENNSYGITLIALVITVIVLLILARHFGEYALTAITAY